LIHRDIKPGNVLLEGGQHRVKITDFGLARAADDASISQSGIIAGTPMYMAPEQAQGQPLDQRADLFSLGSVLYQMVTGRPPFRATNTLAVLKRVAEDTPRAIREIIPETPQWLCDIIAKLHAKDPNDRYQSAREVADVIVGQAASLPGERVTGFSRSPREPANSSLALNAKTKPRLTVARKLVIAAILIVTVWVVVFTVLTLNHVRSVLNRLQNPSQPNASETKPVTAETPVIHGQLLPGAWQNLLPLVDRSYLGKGAVRGEFKRIKHEGKESLLIPAESPIGTPKLGGDLRPSYLNLPVIPRSDYQLRVTLARTTGNNGLVLLLPVANKRAAFILDGFPASGGSTAVGFSQALQPLFVVSSQDRPGQRLTEGKTYQLTISVKQQDGQATIQALLDNRELLSWSGPVDSIYTGRDWQSGDRQCLGIGGWSQYRVDVLELKMLTGHADLLRPLPPLPS
jgi:serine/threonine protein kinase